MEAVKRYLLFILTLLFGFSCSSNDEPNDDGGQAGSSTSQSESFFGVNMSGAEFASVYPGVDGTHYGYPSREDLEYFKKKGFNLIRFPFRWERIQPVLKGELNQTELTKMKKVVQTANELGVQVLLDMHNFGRYCVYCDSENTDNNQYAIIGTAQCKVDDFCDVWKRLAMEFKDYPNIWGYDIMNEPHDMLESVPWFDIAQAGINAIREVDEKTTIIVSGDSYSSSSRWVQYSDDLKNLVDPSDNLIYQAHTYFDKDASGNYVLGYDGLFQRGRYGKALAGSITQCDLSHHFYRGALHHHSDCAAPGRRFADQHTAGQAGRNGASGGNADQRRQNRVYCRRRAVSGQPCHRERKRVHPCYACRARRPRDGAVQYPRCSACVPETSG